MKYQIWNKTTNRDIISQIFINRGITDNIYEFMNPSEKNMLDPLLLDNMEEGVKLLTKHFLAQSKILLVVDCDNDGYVSAALLLNYLHNFFPYTVENNIKFILHNDKFHGVKLDMVDDDIKLVIIPDAGSNQAEEFSELKSRGIDILVLDHHDAEQYIDTAVIINNQLSKNYSNKQLTGAGIVFKLCQYLDTLLLSNQSNFYIDMAAIGLIGDVSALTHLETRYIIDTGLSNLNNKFFKYIANQQAYVLRDGITPESIAFYFVPMVNAIVRSGTYEDKQLIFNALLDYKADNLIPSTKRGHKGEQETIIEQAYRTCTNVKKHQKDNATKLTLEFIKRVEEQNLDKNKVIMLLIDDVEKNNLTGLIATQLVEEYHKPVLLLYKDNDTDTWSGSGRGVDRSELDNFRKFLENSNLVEYSQGHPQAFGASVTTEKVNNLQDYMNDQLKNCTFDKIYNVDLLGSQQIISSTDILKIADLNYLWGKGIEEPLIAIESLHIDKNNLFLMSRDKNPTLKIKLDTGIDLIKFNSSEEEYNSLLDTSVNIVGTCKKNEWNGNITAQILVKDYEIIRKLEFYF